MQQELLVERWPTATALDSFGHETTNAQMATPNFKQIISQKSCISNKINKRSCNLCAILCLANLRRQRWEHREQAGSESVQGLTETNIYIFLNIHCQSDIHFAPCAHALKGGPVTKSAHFGLNGPSNKPYGINQQGFQQQL